MTDERDNSDRTPTRPDVRPSRTATPNAHPIATPSGTNTNAGILASAQWLSARCLRPTPRAWEVEIVMGVRANDTDALFRLSIYAQEWGFFFTHHSRASWIRITDIPFVHGRDDHELLGDTPPLKNIGAFLRKLETKHRLSFARKSAVLTTNLDDAELPIRSWLATL